MAKKKPGARPRIYVLAGTNGAGKSSIGGAMIRHAGGNYFNPDEVARKLASSGLSQTEANAAAWQQGKQLLERAISERLDFAFETTLGGSTMTELLDRAAAQDFEVRIWYVGLASPELHIARVRARVGKGGHDISEADIRRRYDASRINLIRLLPRLTEVRVYDNSADADPHTGRAPEPMLILHLRKRTVVRSCVLSETPTWARPIVAAAIRRR